MFSSKPCRDTFGGLRGSTGRFRAIFRPPAVASGDATTREGLLDSSWALGTGTRPHGRYGDYGRQAFREQRSGRPLRQARARSLALVPPIPPDHAAGNDTGHATGQEQPDAQLAGQVPLLLLFLIVLGFQR